MAAASGYSRNIQVLAVLLACAVLPLILVGAGVTSKDAGMAFPDWPTSDGHLVNPPGWWKLEKTLWEHGHRLIGWTVGMLAIAVTVACWTRGPVVRTLSLSALGAIVIQGVLGGLRVREVSTLLAMLHGIWGQVCFCLTCVTALLTSGGWTETAEAFEARGVVTLRRGCMAALGCTFVQLVLGATYRHFGTSGALAAHLVWAVVVILVLSWLAMWVLEQYPHTRPFPLLGKSLAGLIGTQMFLGGFAFLVTVMGGDWPATLRWTAPSAHVLAGAMLLACVLLLTLCAHRILRPAGREEVGNPSSLGVAAL